jgi:glutamate-1-semialdehyde 2,1-aminomutase
MPPTLYSDIANPVALVLVLGLVLSLILLPRLWRRLQLSRAKHPTLAGHSRMAKRLARWMPPLHYGADRFYDTDGAPPEVVAARQRALAALAVNFETLQAQGLALTQRARTRIADLDFTSRYRVPAPFSDFLRRHLSLPAFIARARSGRLTDLDGSELLDLTGAYGVNVFGIDFYRACIAEAVRRAECTGPVLGPLHPAAADVAERLCRLSGQDAVSFHMSGTEAVMQAVRLARYHTRRSHLVRFCGAYHGWWEDVQPGVGNPLPPRETYTLRDMDERSLRVLASRRDIACVLVNPLQALHPNQSAPGDSTLLVARTLTPADREAYSDWLRQLRAVCTQHGIVLIFDEVFVGFRLAKGGAQEYFGVRADLVTYGKTLGGGLPIGAVCGRADLMRRYRTEAPADICFARGTFNSHPYVMCAAQVFLEQIEDGRFDAAYAAAEETWQARLAACNDALAAAEFPLRVVGLQSIWSLTFNRPGRYHWMLQFYLREAGLAVSWVGSGRLIFALVCSDADFAEFMDRLLAAARRMDADGWWWQPDAIQWRNAQRRFARDMLRAAWARWTNTRDGSDSVGLPQPEERSAARV